MEPRKENRERDDRLDSNIDSMLAGAGSLEGRGTTIEQVANEFARLASEESPRMSSAARANGMNALRSRATTKRAEQRPNPFAFLVAIPRWAQIAAVAIVVVLVANGVSTVAANSLPGSLLYPFKRFTEGGQLLLQNTNGQRAQLWMNFANTRLDEVQRLLNAGSVVDPTFLDSVDESILRALSEITGTRGDERVALLQQLTQSAMRQQQIVDQLAQSASPTDRTRLEQTAKLLAGVAGFAQSPDALNGSTPFQFLTPTVTPSPVPTSTPSMTPLPTRTPILTSTAVPSETPSHVPAAPLVTTDKSNNTGNSGAIDNTNDNANTNDNGNANDNSGNDDSSDGNSNDNSQNDNGGNGNSNDNSQDDNGGKGGGDNQSDNGDKSGGGDNQNDNAGKGDAGSENDNGNEGGSGDNQNDNGGKGGGDNRNDNGDKDGGGGDNENDNGGKGS